MTTFHDGPAQGQTLMLRRAVCYLRVVVSRDGHWDALDQPDDTVGADETVYAYLIIMNPRPSMIHIRAAKGRGGFFTIAKYRFCLDQPSQEVMRDEQRWGEWCRSDHAELEKYL